jgi:hypothetical protein
MNIDNMTYGELKQIAAMFSQQKPVEADSSGLIGKYVIVRCRDAGVHSGFLESRTGRECVLTESRRLWYWKPADGQKYLSGIATHGVDDASKLAAPLPKILLTENCEIILCTDKAMESIQGANIDANK